MGIFTWTFADLENRRKLDYGTRGTIACPDGSFIEEPCYQGYGMFGSHDIYELVVDWNKAHLDDILARIMRPVKETGKWHFGKGMVPFAHAYQNNDMDEIERLCKKVEERCDLGYSYMRDWKRELGITIACEDEDNRALPFPIKVVSKAEGIVYSELPSSKSTQ